MNRKLRILLVVTALVLTAGCSTLSVSYDYDNNVDFTKFKTYAWMAQPAGVPVNALEAQGQSGLLDGRIRESIAVEMADRGFTEDANAPDLLIVHHLGAKEKIQVTDWGYRYSDYYWGYGGRQIDVHQYTEGMLVIDLVDGETKALVWRGTGTKVVENVQRSPEEVQARIDNVVMKIMESFPPQGE